MSGIINRGTPEHNAHLEGVKRDAEIDKTSDKNSEEFNSGFEIGKSREKLEPKASESKKAGYAFGMSAGKGGTATSPQTAFSKPPTEIKPEEIKPEEPKK